MNRKTVLRKITVSAVIAALYVALTLIFQPISFYSLQFRISETLMLLPLLFPESWIGLTVGCLLANLLGGGVIWDIIFGTLASMLAVLIVAQMGKISKKNIVKFLSPLPVIILNGVIVGVVVTYCYTDLSGLSNAAIIGAMFFNMLSVAIGETAVCYVLGVPLLFTLSKTGLADLISTGRKKDKNEKNN
ncbi:MAG: QueT transporter family protein [Clostridia bacterium]|nr:QueT transporter family protein [Clostridia bacterium]